MSDTTLNAPPAHPNRYSLTDPSIPVSTAPDRIRHMLEAIGRLEELTSRFSTAEFLVEELPQSAACRAFGILGIAAEAVPAAMRRKYPTVAWNQWAQYGAELPTNYDEVDCTRLWLTATRALPGLREEMQKLLEAEAEAKPGLAA